MAEKIDGRVIVEDDHFAYLKLQKGRLHAFIQDRERWHQAYESDLQRTYTEIRPHLPARCWGMLDIGSGLGGIDVLLYRHYFASIRGGPYVNLLDGESDPPEMILHRETFNDMRVAKSFLTRNGVRSDRFAYYTPRHQDYVKPYDLVVSFGSWCFHYEPNVYLPRLRSGGGLHRESIVIVDRRRDKPEWSAQLDAVLEQRAIVRESRKFDRVVYAVRCV